MFPQNRSEQSFEPQEFPGVFRISGLLLKGRWSIIMDIGVGIGGKKVNTVGEKGRNSLEGEKQPAAPSETEREKALC